MPASRASNRAMRRLRQARWAGESCKQSSSQESLATSSCRTRALKVVPRRSILAAMEASECSAEQPTT
eukprot:13929660-Alexandrium_andersonii.AAC.1